ATPEPEPPPVPPQSPDLVPVVVTPVANKPDVKVSGPTPVQSYGRADVDQAAERMGWKLGSKREVKKLVEHLWDGETVERLVSGTYGGGTGILALTDRRLIFLRDGWTSKTVEDFPLDKISSVQWSSGMLMGSIMIFVSGNKSAVTNVQKDSGKALTDDVRGRISGARSRPDAAPAQPVAQPVEQAPDPMAVLERLAQLHSAGILSDDEFATKKAEILKRL
ncbi:MAG: PH domain-containing protein, partial [Actinomycetes bacterium]